MDFNEFCNRMDEREKKSFRSWLGYEVNKIKPIAWWFVKWTRFLNGY